MIDRVATSCLNSPFPNPKEEEDEEDEDEESEVKLGGRKATPNLILPPFGAACPPPPPPSPLSSPAHTIKGPFRGL